MCKSDLISDSSSCSTGSSGGSNSSGMANMSSINHDESNHSSSTPSTTPTTTTTTRPQQLQQQDCTGPNDTSNTVRTNEFHHRDSYQDQQNPSIERRTRLRAGLNNDLSSFMKIRSIFLVVILILLIVMGALFRVHLFLPQQSILPLHPETAAAAMSSSETSSPFMIVIDGGSTGSRLHVFEFVILNDNVDGMNTTTTGTAAAATTTTIVERRGSFRTISPLSTFITTTYDEEDGHMENSYVNKTALYINHITPLLQYIERTIPISYIYTTPIYYAATAGMRLLSTSQQNLIYDTFIQIVIEYCHERSRDTTTTTTTNYHMGSSNSCFHFPRHHIQTLSGDLEAYYGVLAANYLHGKIDTNLHMTNNNQKNNNNIKDTVLDDTATSAADSSSKSDSGDSKSITGALDMGGSSTQIVFYTARDATDLEEDNEVCMNSDNVGKHKRPTNKSNQLKERHFFSMSYLSYGVDQFRDRLWNLLIYEFENSKLNSNEMLMSNNNNNNLVVLNPCSNPGHNVTTTINATTYLLVGAGNVLVCKEYMKRIIPHPIHTPIHHIYDESLYSTSSDSKMVGGIEHPSIYNESPPTQQQEEEVVDDDKYDESNDGTQSPDFLAMSLYFFTFDSIRVFTKDLIVNERWPKPTLLELQNATSTYCSMDLMHDIYPLYDNDPQQQPHPYTRKGIVQHRCMEAIYMISLLETFGFTNHERHITFAFDVNGSEVEWTLGMALQYHSNNNNNTTDQQQRTCAWDGRVPGITTDTDRATPGSTGSSILSHLPASIVQWIRNYFAKI